MNLSLKAWMRERILVLDGGMGTMIQRFGLTESDYRGADFVDNAHALMGNNDILPLTRPDVILSIHEAYLEAGADIIETCSFGANAVVQTQYGLSVAAAKMAFAAACVARQAATKWADKTGRPRFVAGSVGPTHVSLSMASTVETPEKSPVTFEQMVTAYEDQIGALIDGGVDVILVETIFDFLNAKAAYEAYARALASRTKTPSDIPIVFSATIADIRGRLLNGQMLSAFCAAASALKPLAIGLNCGFGAAELAPFLAQLADLTDLPIWCYPNAGLPDKSGSYLDDAAKMAQIIGEFARQGQVNVVGGCCGTTPEHIRAMRDTVNDVQPRAFGATNNKTMFSGLNAVEVQPEHRVVIAERTNVTGSRKFKRLINEQNWDEAIDVARHQMRSGAQMIDICMDDAMLDGPIVMREFLRRLNAEPEISQYPYVIDSSNFEVIRAALTELPGRCLVNSISLKGGEAAFLEEARALRRAGAGVVIMAFDEAGQAVTTERRVEILSRAIDLLTTQAGFDEADLVADPNILAIGTGMPEHDRQALSFLEACRLLRKKYPAIQTSGGLSNLSFAFRGRDDVRAAIHAAFLDKAGDALTMVIANPEMMPTPSEIDTTLLALARDLVDARPGASEALLDWIAGHALVKTTKPVADDDVASMPPAQRLGHALITGESRYLAHDVETLLESMTPLQIIEGPLMDGMTEVGARFSTGAMFLPQIIRSARLMKQAIACLPLTESQNTSGRKKILMATVWGDVHDIGKNIVTTVLTCNGYAVIDLGVMVPTASIVETAIRENVDAIGLSGLISPSLKVMEEVAHALNAANVHVPLFVGGAATCDEHVALKIAPVYAPGVVTHITDASRVPVVLGHWLNAEKRKTFENEVLQAQASIRDAVSSPSDDAISLEEARARRPKHEFRQNTALDKAPTAPETLTWSLDELINHLNYAPLIKTLGAGRALDAETREALRRDCNEVLRAADAFHAVNVRGRFQFVEARGGEEKIEVFAQNHEKFVIQTPRVCRKSAACHALSDFLPTSHASKVGLFAMNCQIDREKIRSIAAYTVKDEAYVQLVLETCATGLVSAANDVLHENLMARYGQLVRPAPGYPMIPDHRIKVDILRTLNAQELGMTLTENFMMSPLASICGITIFHEDAVYFQP